MADENDLGKGLLEQQAKGTPVPAGMSEELAKRVKGAKRTVWGLAALTVALWGCVGAGAVCFCWCFVTYVLPMVRWLSAADDESRAELTGVIWKEIKLIGDLTLIGTYVWAVLIIMAAVCTVLFILASRRATLRQIHGSLEEISGQLRAISER